jgi:NADPH2:quinone reductase
MLAAFYERTGSADDVLCVAKMDTPVPNSGEVLVRIATSGINPSDVKTRAGARGELAFPRIVPHSDGAGIIEQVGDGVDVGRVGERVWVYNAAWKRPFGTAAQYVALPATQAVPLPDSVAFEVGACMGIPAMTAHRCVFSGGSVEGQTVLVTGGAGAVGHYAIQLAKWGGATVITTVSGDEKARHAELAGPDHIINYKTEDTVSRVNEITSNEGVDRIVEVEFGGNLAVTTKILKTNGAIAAYGSVADPTPQLPFYDLMFKGIQIQSVLVYVLSDAARKAAIADLSRALVAPGFHHAVAKSFVLEETAKAHKCVEAGKVIGNVVLNVS